VEIARLEHARDQQTLLRGCKLAALALQEGPGRSMGGRLYAPTQAELTDPEWLAFFRRTAALNWHPTTCRMYADDHAPPHFQIEAPDFEVLVRLSDFAVIAGAARPAQIAEVLEWAAGERTVLVLKWSELNERG
jgi:hypothetical protein